MAAPQVVSLHTTLARAAQATGCSARLWPPAAESFSLPFPCGVWLFPTLALSFLPSSAFLAQFCGQAILGHITHVTSEPKGLQN